MLTRRVALLLVPLALFPALAPAQDADPSKLAAIKPASE